MLTEIKKELTNLKLAGISKNIEEKIEYATEKKLSHLEFMKLLLDEENLSRKNNSLKRRIMNSCLPKDDKTIENYDFTFQPSLNKSQIINLSSCNFIDKKENIIFIGKPGTGKTHLSKAIGLKAILKGYTVLFISAPDLIKEIQQSKADGTYYSKLNQFIKPDLLIIDELGFKKFTQNGADDLFEIVNQRYEHKSIIITSNKFFEDWGNILFDQVLASAMIDRLVHFSTIIHIEGDSWRTKSYKEKNNTKNVK